MKGNNRKIANFWILRFLLILFVGNIMLPCASSNNQKTISIEKSIWKNNVKNKDYTETYKDKDYSSVPIKPSLPKFESFKIVFYILIIIVLILFIILLLRSDILKLSNQKANKIKISLENFEDNLPDADLNDLLIDALKKELYILAVRIQFLMVIKELDKKQLIYWRKNKTNGDYLLEMRKTRLFGEFQHLTLIFEKIWYGEQMPNSMQYNALAVFYQRFKSKIESNEQ